MGRLASIDGIITAPEDAKISVYDRGFLYGDSVFETLRTYAGEPFALPDHLARLERSAAKVGITLPIEQPAFAMEVRLALRAAKNPESYARIIVTRGEGPLGLDPAMARAPRRVILIEPLSPLPASVYRDGVSVITAHTERASDAAPGAKVSNYLASMLALQRARRANAHEALITNAQGAILEGTTSNIFGVRNGALVTPPEESGILAGITRKHILEIANELGYRVDEEVIRPDELGNLSEMFLSSSLREIVPIICVDDRTIGDGRPGPITRAIHTAFRHHVGLGGEPMPWEG